MSTNTIINTSCSSEIASALTKYNLPHSAITSKRAAIVHAHDAITIQSNVISHHLGFIEPIFIGDSALIRNLAEAVDVDISQYEVIHSDTEESSAQHASSLAKENHVQILIKGKIQTATLMRHVLDRNNNLRTNKKMSHAFLVSSSTYHKPFILTDAAINISPDLDTKKDIISNSVNLFTKLYDKIPKVALLSASELVNTSMPNSLECAALCKMADRKQIEGCIIDGPLAFDNAFSHESAKIKGINSPVAGDTDIFVVPNIEAGNIAYKQMSMMTDSLSAGIVLGSKVPIVLTSRSETDSIARAISCAVAAKIAT